MQRGHALQGEGGWACELCLGYGYVSVKSGRGKRLVGVAGEMAAADGVAGGCDVVDGG